MLTDKELQSLRNLGNEAEAAVDEILKLRAALDAAVATEREHCKSMVKTLMSQVHSSDARYMSLLKTTGEMIDMIQAAKNYCSHVEANPCHTKSSEYEEFLAVFGPNVRANRANDGATGA